MTQDPLKFKSHQFKDSNGYTWSAFKKGGLGSPVIIEVEHKAPYPDASRKFEMPPNADNSELRAAANVIALGFKKEADAKKKADQDKRLQPTKPDNSEGAGWLILIIIGLLALSSKKGKR